jgi:hypothetical protein
VKEVPKGGEGRQEYLEKLALHHQAMREAMKTKQTVDTADVDSLEATLAKLEGLYHTH